MFTFFSESLDLVLQANIPTRFPNSVSVSIFRFSRFQFFCPFPGKFPFPVLPRANPKFDTFCCTNCICCFISIKKDCSDIFYLPLSGWFVWFFCFFFVLSGWEYTANKKDKYSEYLQTDTDHEFWYPFKILKAYQKICCFNFSWNK